MTPNSSARPPFFLKDLLLGAFVLFAFLSDSLLIYAHGQASLSFKEMVVFFVGSRVILFTTLIFFYRWGVANRFLILFALLVGTLGPIAFLIGSFVLIYLSFFYLFSERSNPGIVLAEDEIEELCENLALGSEDVKDHLKTQPFEEILERGEDEQKYLVLIKISRHPDPLFVSILKKALNDSSRIIKVSAATILTSLDDEFTQKITTLEKIVFHQPLQADAWANLAAEQYKYACSNLLDKPRELQLRHQAIVSYHSFLDLVKDVKPLSLAQKEQIQLAKTHLGLAYLQEREYQKAYPFLKPSEIAYPLSPSELSAELALVPFYCECLFGLKQYALLKQIAADLLAGSQKDPDLYALDFQEAIKIWVKGSSVKQGIYVHQVSEREKDHGQDEVNTPS